jgi:hypothetical protein
MLNQAKDVAQKISIDMVMNSPIYLALQDGAITSGSPAGKKEKIGDDLQQYISASTSSNALNSFIRVSTGSSAPTEDANRDLGAAYLMLLQHSSRGKGFPLSRGRRDDFTAERAVVMSAITALWDFDATHMSANMYDAMALAYALALYLQLEDEYDMNFPATTFQLNSAAWAQTMRASAHKATAIWSKIAVAPFSFDLSVATHMWKSERDFYEGFLPQTSVKSDMTELWDRYQAILDPIVNADFAKLATTAFNRITTCYNSTHVLPPAYGEELIKLQPSQDRSDPKKCINAIIVSKPFKYEYSDRQAILSHLMTKASAITSAIDFYAQSLGILALNFQPEQNFSDITKPLDLIPIPVSGTVESPSAAGFSLVDPISIVRIKYSEKVEAAQTGPGVITSVWASMSDLLTPMFRSARLKKAVPTKPLVMWSPTSNLPLATVLSRPYLAQPVPACYTATRNRTVVSYDASTYVGMLDGSPMGIASSEVMSYAASILASDEPSFREAITNAMAAVGYWYDVIDPSKPVLIKPTIPAIYGVPLNAHISEMNPPDKKNELQTITVKLDHVPTRSFAFVLHDKYPVPTVQATIPWSPAPGVDLQVRLNAEDYALLVAATGYVTTMAVASMADSASAFSGAKAKKRWVKPGGFLPVMLNFPHVLFDVWTPDTELMTSLIQDHTVTIAKRIHPVTKDVVMQGFFNDPVEILDALDLGEALNQPDPIPGASTISSADDVISPVSGVDPTRSITPSPAPPSGSIMPHSEASAREAAAAVSGAAIPTRVEGVQSESSARLSGGDTVSFEPLDPLVVPHSDGGAPLSNDPLPDAPAGSPTAVATSAVEAQAAKTKKYKKRLPDGTWEYKMIKAGDPIPEGFVPAGKEDEVGEGSDPSKD